MFVLIDNFDSFTYNLVRYFEELGQEIKVFRADKVDIDEVCSMNPQGIIISPGPKSPKEAENSLKTISEFKGKLPILGVCLGHQCIGYFFGAKIVKGEEPVHGKISKVYHNGSGIFKDLKSPYNITRYHSLVVEKESLPESLEITAWTADGVVMGIEHKEFPVYGVQFHPEAELTEMGHELLNNFINICLESGKISDSMD
ncbi:MAG: aminodeoxychorismate/anthranilate synthase component II [Clostridiaceae bacterium]